MTNNEKQKKHMVLIWVVLIIGAAAIAVCAYGLLKEIFTGRQGKDYYAELTDNILSIPDIEIPMSYYPVYESVADDLDEAVKPKSAEPYLMNFETLLESCPDAVAWVRCEGTPIDYPIVQGNDNDYYLEHLPDGSKNKIGSIFMDYRNSGDLSDKNTLIYGHRVKNGEMFSALKEYSEQLFYIKHPCLYLYTPDANYVVELFAGYVIDSGYEKPPISFINESDFERYITRAKRRSVFDSDVSVTMEDQIITLCTCDYSYTNARFILNGKLVKLDIHQADMRKNEKLQ